MKKLTLILFAICCFSCNAQLTKSSVVIEKNYDVEQFQKLYSNLEDGVNLKERLKKFDVVFNGIFLYKLPESSTTGRILTLDFDRKLKASDSSREFAINETEQKKLDVLISKLGEGFYFEESNQIDCIYVILIKQNGELFSGYFSTSYPQFRDSVNFYQPYKDIFDIIYRNLYNL